MKKIYMIMMLVVLMCSLSVVSASDNVSVSDNVSDIGDVSIISENLDEADIESDDSPDIVLSENTTDTDDDTSNKDTIVIIEAHDMTAYVGNDTYQFRLLDDKGNPISNAQVTISYTFKDKVTTDDLGIGTYNLGLTEPGNYKLTLAYAKQSVSVNVKILANETENTTSGDTNQNETPVVNAKIAKVVTRNIASTYGEKVKYTVTVLDKSGKGIFGKTVTVTIGSKVKTATTNKKGVASFKFNRAAGTYNIFYSVDKFKGSNTYKVSNRITFTTLNWGLKGDVRKNSLIKNNMPNNKWVKKAVKATKNGLPLLKFEGGKGKIVFMTAGVHGNEISSQVAAMKMIDYLSKHPIKGTVYIIPFVNVKAISKKVRYTDKDFNRVANRQGTVSNKIVKLVVSCKANAYGDFHTTQPGGAPGQNIVMGSKSPTAASAKLTKYISKNCKVNKRTYSYAGQEYPGALADNVNRYGIPAVICEVVLPHNTVTASSVAISYNMMQHLLKFNSVI